MGKLRCLSGDELIRTFDHFGFQIASQRGSHIKVRRVTSAGIRQTLTVVLHDEIDKGTPVRFIGRL